MQSLSSHFSKNIRLMVTAVVLISSLVVLSPRRAYAADPVTLSTVIKVISTAYSLYKTGESIFGDSSDFQDDLDKAKREIIAQTRDVPLVGTADGLIDLYGIAVRNHARDMLDDFMIQSVVTLGQFYQIINQRDPEAAYRLLPSYNVLTVLTARAMQELKPGEVIYIDDIFTEAMSINHMSVGARIVTVTLPMPFGLPPVKWDISTIELSTLWNTPRFFHKGFHSLCAIFGENSCNRLVEYVRSLYDQDETVQLVGEAMCQIRTINPNPLNDPVNHRPNYAVVGLYTIVDPSCTVQPTSVVLPVELEWDTDGDGLVNGDEVTSDTDPLAPDTDGDGVGDTPDNCRLTPNPDQAEGMVMHRRRL